MNFLKKSFKSSSPNRYLAAIAYDYSHKIAKKLPGIAAIQNQAIALLLGGNISADRIAEMKERQDPFWLFIKANHLHHIFNSSGERLPYLLEGIKIGDQWVSFSRFKVTTDGDEKIFHLDGKVAFKTDASYKLKGAYYCGVSGLVQGEQTAPLPENRHLPVIKRPPQRKASRLDSNFLQKFNKPWASWRSFFYWNRKS